MFTFVLILLLLAAIAGVLGAVLKVTLVLVVSLFLAVVLLGWIGMWYAKRRMRELQRDVQIRLDVARRRREAYDAGDQGGTPGGDRHLGDGG